MFCLDNDPAGREASVALARKYGDKGFYTRIELPTGKDINEDLTMLLAEKTRNRRTNCLRKTVDIVPFERQ